MAETKITIKPLIDTKTGVFCHLLELGNTKIVVDCGITDDFDYSIYNSVKDTIHAADCILLTSFDLQHMGAVGLFSDSLVFCTIPTAVLGKIMLDELNHLLGEKVLNTFVPKQIKFSQPFKVKDIEITSFNAGYIIGNAIYKIARDLESITVCYNFNHRRENFLDGMAHANIENSNIFMTNTSYLSVTSHSLRARDERILDLVNKSHGKVIFSVSYQRLLELMCILYKHKLTVVSKNGRMFMDRVRSMVEWAGSKAAETVPLLDVSFKKVAELENQKILILVNEIYNEGYLGAVLRRFNEKQNTLVLIDQDVTSIDLGKINIYEYAYREKQLQASDETEEIVSDDDEESEGEHWSREKHTLFVDGVLDRKDNFPHIKRRRQNNEYGEAVTFKFEKKVEETELKAAAQPVVEEIEEKTLVSVGVDPNVSVVSIGLGGISDYTSYKTICEGMSCKTHVIAQDNGENAMFLSSYLSTCKLKVDSYVADGKTTFSTAKPAEKITVTDRVMNQEFYRLLDKSVVHFKARRTGGLLDCVGVCKPIVFGNFDSEAIKKSLIESGFQIQTEDDALLINGEMRIDFNTTGLAIDSGDSNLLIAVRDVLYQHVAII